MRISIIIPVYNVEQYIEECLNSVIAQTYTGDMECFLIDDCGTDNSIAIANRIIKNYQGNIKFRILHHEHNRGLSAARNTGIDASTGDYLYFLDSDDYISSKCIEALSKQAEKYPEVNIVQGNIIENGTFAWMRIDNMPDYSDDKRWIAKHIFSDIPMTVWNKLIRKDLIVFNSLYFREGLINEDEHWRLISYSHIKDISFCKVPTYFYRIRENSIMDSQCQRKRMDNYLRIADDILLRNLYVECLWSARFLFFYLLKVGTKTQNIQDLNQYTKERRKRIVKIVHSNIIPIRTRFVCLMLLFGMGKYPVNFHRILKLIFYREYYYDRFSR